MKNILVVDDEWPSPYSGKFLRISNIFARLKKHFFIHYLYIGAKELSGKKYLDNFTQGIHHIKWRSRASLWGRIKCLCIGMPSDNFRVSARGEYTRVVNEIRELIKKYDIDALHHFSYFNSCFLEDIHGVYKIWDVGDSLWLNKKRKQKTKPGLFDIKKSLYLNRILNFERAIVQNNNKVIFVSSSDADVHKSKDGDKIDVIPNGVDLDYFCSSSGEEHKPYVVFTGHMNFEPNVSAVQYFCGHVWPIVREKNPGLEFYIVGAEPNAEVILLSKQDGVIVTGAVEDIRPFIRNAAVYVAPLISGSGIKNKLLQAMAMQKPVVSTNLGAEALGVSDGKDMLLADSPGEFAEKIHYLLNNKESRRQIGRNALEFVRVNNDWDKIGKYYLEKIYA